MKQSTKHLNISKKINTQTKATMNKPKSKQARQASKHKQQQRTITKANKEQTPTQQQNNHKTQVKVKNNQQTNTPKIARPK